MQQQSAAGRGSSAHRSFDASSDTKAGRTADFREAAIVALPSEGVLAAGAAEMLHDSLALDDSVLRALHQLSGQQVEGLADLRKL